MIKFYLFVTKSHPRQGKHNAMQKGDVLRASAAGDRAVLTGLAIWKPVQLGWITALFGGYVWARYWHFMTMVALIVLSFVHIFMVFAVDPYSLRRWSPGGYRRRSFTGSAQRAPVLSSPLFRDAARSRDAGRLTWTADAF